MIYLIVALILLEVTNKIAILLPDESTTPCPKCFMSSPQLTTILVPITATAAILTIIVLLAVIYKCHRRGKLLGTAEESSGVKHIIYEEVDGNNNPIYEEIGGEKNTVELKANGAYGTRFELSPNKAYSEVATPV